MSCTKLNNTLRNHPLILPIYLPSILIAISWGIREPVFPLYLRAFGAPYWMVGLVMSGQAIGMLLTDIFSGLVIRRLGQRRAMILGLGCVSLSTIAIFWARSVPEVFAFRILAGIGFSIFGVSRHAYIAENVAYGIRGRAIALFGGLNRIGRFAGPAIGGFIANAFELRTPFLVMGGLVGLACLVVISTVRENPAAKKGDHPSLKEYISQLLTVAREHRRILSTVGAGQLFAQFVRTGRGVIIPLYGADVLGLDVVSIGLIASVASSIDMLLFYPAGMLMDRLGRKFAIVPSFFIQGLGLALVPLTGGFTSLVIVSGLIGFGNGLGSGTMMVLGADLAPVDVRGEFLGMWRLIGDTGFTVGPLLTGTVANLLTLPMASLVMAASGLIATLIFVFLVPETGRRKSRKMG